VGSLPPPVGDARPSPRVVATMPTILVVGIVHHLEGLRDLGQLQRTRWSGLASHAAAGPADLVVVGMTLRALAPQHQDSLPVAILLQLTLLGAYVVSIAIRTLLRNRNVTLFEIVQTAAALVLGFGGAVFLTRATGAVPVMIGLVSLVAGIACYGVAFAFVDSHEELRRNVYFYTTLALVLVLAGLTLDLRQQWLGVVFAVFGVLAAVSWSRYGRLYMLLHGAVYVVAAAIASGTLTYSVWALAASPAGSWVLPGGLMLLVVIAGSARFPGAW